MGSIFLNCNVHELLIVKKLQPWM